MTAGLKHIGGVKYCSEEDVMLRVGEPFMFASGVILRFGGIASEYVRGSDLHQKIVLNVGRNGSVWPEYHVVTASAFGLDGEPEEGGESRLLMIYGNAGRRHLVQIVEVNHQFVVIRPWVPVRD